MTTAVTDLFLSLTPDKVLEAVEAGGLRCNPVCYALNSFENRVYEIELEDGSRVVSKFYRPGRWSEQQLLEEHQFLSDLEQAEIEVCGVLPFPDGSSLKRVDHIYYCLFPRKGGRAPDELSDEGIERLGMMAARMHNVGAQRDAASRIRISSETYVHNNLEFMQANQVIPDYLEARYVAAAQGIAQIMDERMRGVAIHRIHGDFHLGNVLLREERFYALDFDDMVVGPAIQDMWLLIPGRGREVKRKQEIWLEGYQQFRDIDHQTLALVEPLRGLRYIHYAAWLARRWHDPAFPATWPHFGSEDYWAQETVDLEEQLQICRLSDPHAEPDESDGGEEELTNKDFFWDMED